MNYEIYRWGVQAGPQGLETYYTCPTNTKYKKPTVHILSILAKTLPPVNSLRYLGIKLKALTTTEFYRRNIPWNSTTYDST